MIPARFIFIMVIVVCGVLAVLLPAAAQDESTSPMPDDPRPYFDRMARFLADTKQFETTIRIGYDVVQESGQKIEFSERRRITIARPDRFRAEVTKSSGEKGLVVFDGKKITAYSETHKVYAEADRPGRLNDALVYFLRDLQMRMPLALMFTSTFEQEIDKRLEELVFVEVSEITDRPCVHLAGRTGQVDFQMWLPETGDPLPRRVVITYRNEEGQPNFWADFENWELAPAIAPQDFVFTPPPGTERIPFLAEVGKAPKVEDRKGGD